MFAHRPFAVLTVVAAGMLAAGCGTSSDGASNAGADTATATDIQGVDSATVEPDAVGTADISPEPDSVDVGSVAPVACQSDKECISVGLVCDKAGGVCVDCNSDADCGSGESCKAKHCVPPPASCTSSKDCAALAQVCDKASGFCVDCTNSDDCAAGQVCLETLCVAQLCTPNATECDANGQLAVCATDGTAWAAVACPAGQVCKGGACHPPVCSPGVKACDGNAVQVCEADGLAWKQAVPCAVGTSCVDGACFEQQCSPGVKTCPSPTTLADCPAGALEWQFSPCPAGESCMVGPAGAECVETVCTPGSKVCDGDLVRECSVLGTLGDVDADCAAESKTCKAGLCVQPDCVDKDGDGAGVGCPKGPDCDDDNPNFAAACPDCAAKSTTGCACTTPGETMACGELPAGTAGVGTCKLGQRTCTSGYWSGCEGVVEPKIEACDGSDDDCDGETDEDVKNACGTCTATCGAVGPVDGKLPAPTTDSGATQDANGNVSIGAGTNVVDLDAIWIANSTQDTVSKVSTSTKKEVGRYNVCGNPSRTAVDLDGNVWIGCRKGGGILKIISNPANCIDKNNNGTIETSKDLDGNGTIGANEILAKGTDECVAVETVPLAGESIIRAAGIDKDNHAWFGGWNTKSLVRVHPSTGAVVKTVSLGCPPYGLTIAPSGTIWIQCTSGGLARYEPSTNQLTKTPYVAGAYGIAIDHAGRVWVASGANASRYDPETGKWDKVAGITGGGSGGGGRGVAATANGRVLVAIDGGHKVTVIDADSLQILGYVSLGPGRYPVGVAVDFAGKGWTVNQSAGSATRFDIDSFSVLAEVKVGSGPYTYSDMTGYVLHTFSAPKAIYTVTLDGSAKLPAGGNVVWQSLDLVAQVPAETSIAIRARVANSVAALEQAVWQTIGTVPGLNVPIDLSKVGSFVGTQLEVEFLLQASPQKVSPVLNAVTAVADGQP
ncbi:MAG: hypothetical protein H6747_05400 [Deltaproteobacteria bacterium]|nr:hypothetical protein [Deltaproteobacteria bacterium]